MKFEKYVDPWQNAKIYKIYYIIFKIYYYKLYYIYIKLGYSIQNYM